MAKYKFLFVLIMVAALLVLQVGAVFAAPAEQATAITGTVQTITQSTDSSGATVFIVTIVDSAGKTQTVTVSANDAVNAGLVTDNKDGTYTVNSAAIGTSTTVTGTVEAAGPCASTGTTGTTGTEGTAGTTGTTTAMQPVAAALTAFFCATEGGTNAVDKSISELHADGFGFGEIAQACFMAVALDASGGTTTCSSILEAKKSGDYSTLGLPDGSTISNWGQLKKFVLNGYVKSVVNLGGIMSGRADPANPLPTKNGHGHGGNGNGNGHGNGNGNGNGHNP